MKYYVYDCEALPFDWLVVFKDLETEEYAVFHNDSELLRDFINPDAIYFGFNSKSYDQYIIKAIASDVEVEMLKELSDDIVAGQNGWEHPLMQNCWFNFNNCDIRDDCQAGLSLKAIEGHLGMPIQESSIPFDLPRPLRDEELDELIYYCKHDVDTTEQIVLLRKNYLQSKISVGKMAGLSIEKSLSMTNAKLTAAFLKAQKPLRQWTDERQYKYPANLKREYIPQEVFDFFNRMYDPNVSDDDLFKSKLELSLGGTPTVVGFGGIHAAIPFYVFEEKDDTEKRILRNWDVSSYYPSLMIQNGYSSRNIPSFDSFKDVYERRIKAKKEGDKTTANSLKLVLNTTYGATLNRYNELYDPMMARSVCISGQLYLMELASHLLADVPELRIVALNTDGIMVEFNCNQYETINEIVQEWQERTHFGLEEDVISRYYAKDVNNYVEIDNKGNVKTKGGYVVRGVAPAGAFNINNNATIVAKAIREYFVNGTSVEDTVNSSADIFEFQIIAKAGVKYREAFHVVDGVNQPVQRVNRVYATTDERYGKLFKVKAESDSTAKIEMLPEHCIIDNNNELTIDQVDRTFYIELAKKRINDFKGIKPEKKGRKKMATEPKKVQNLYTRLANVRSKFLDARIQKTGKNGQLKSMYFQLDDIVPVAMPLFHEENLLPVMNFTNSECSLTIIDMLDDTKTLTFVAPVREWNGNAAVTPIQATGAMITYMRRYLYQIALDIVEVDEMESGLMPNPSAPKPATPAAPKIQVTPEKREAVAHELAAPEGQATSLQVTQLKKKLKDLRTKTNNTKDVEEWIAKIAVETRGFTNITKSKCEEIIQEVVEKLGGIK